MRKHTRRGLLGLGVLAATAPGIAQAFGFEELDPSDTVPRRFSVKRFLSLSRDDLYLVNLAVRRGRGIIIEGYSRSESRKIIQLANEDPKAARALLSR